MLANVFPSATLIFKNFVKIRQYFGSMLSLIVPFKDEGEDKNTARTRVTNSKEHTART